MSNVLLKYRKELFGIGAIGVLAVHSKEYIEYSYWMTVLISYGGIGIYLFAFLSGIGLYYSMSKNVIEDKNEVIEFYKRRLVRVAIPYVVIAFIWYGTKYLFVENDIIKFIYEFTTLSFWVEHKGAWYVAMLVPLYIVYPWYYKMCKKTEHIYCGGVAIVVALIGLAVYVYFNQNLCYHISAVVYCIIIFLLGDVCGQKIDNGTFKGWLVVSVTMVMFIVGMKTPIENVLVIEKLSRPLLGVGLTIIAANILDLIKVGFVHKCLKFIGEYSLEIYLTNIFLVQADQYFGWGEKIGRIIGEQYSNYCMYMFIVVVGIIISVLISRVCRKISTVRQ